MKFGNEAGKALELPISYSCNKCGDSLFFQSSLGTKCTKCGEGIVVAKMSEFQGLAVVDLGPEVAKEIEDAFKDQEENKDQTIEEVKKRMADSLAKCVISSSDLNPCFHKMGLSTLTSIFSYLNQVPTLQVMNETSNGGGS